MIEAKVYATLNGSTLVTAKTSSRIYPPPLPQAAAFPAVAYERTGGERVYSLSGYSNLDRHDVRIIVYGQNVTSIDALSTAVLATMEASTHFKATNSGMSDDYDDMLEMRTRDIFFSVWERT